jgi:hypothetical protein
MMRTANLMVDLDGVEVAEAAAWLVDRISQPGR